MHYRHGRKEQPAIRKGGWGWLGPPLLPGSPMVPAEGGPNILKRKSSWHRRHRSENSAVSLKHWKGRRRAPPAVCGRSNTSLGAMQKGDEPDDSMGNVVWLHKDRGMSQTR